MLAARVETFWTRFACEIEERLGQYYGVRVESPFVDRELADVLVGVSPSLRSSAEGQKLPLRTAMADRLPESILRRMDKSFFDPVFELGYGRPQAGRNVGQTVAEHYLASWRCFLTEGKCAVGYPLRITQGPSEQATSASVRESV